MLCPLTLCLPAFQGTLPPFPKSREPIDELTSVRLSEAIFPVYLFILWYDLISPLRCPCLVWRTDTPSSSLVAMQSVEVTSSTSPCHFFPVFSRLFVLLWLSRVGTSHFCIPQDSTDQATLFQGTRLCAARCAARSAAPDCHSPAFLLFLSALCFCLALLTRHPKHVERQGSISAFKHSFWCPCCHFPFEENLKIIFFPKFKGKNQTFFSPCDIFTLLD